MTVSNHNDRSGTKSIPINWIEDEINNWFDKKEWLNSWSIQADDSVNKKELAIAFCKNPERWHNAFDYLKTTDLVNAPVGKTELDGDNLFAIIAEYLPKKKQEVRYESHQKYIDIQYVIKGEEIMGITTRDKVIEDEAYNEEKDIAFYLSEEGDYRLATPAVFFVFFSENMHRPSISTGSPVFVKKVVIKVKVD